MANVVFVEGDKDLRGHRGRRLPDCVINLTSVVLVLLEVAQSQDGAVDQHVLLVQGQDDLLFKLQRPVSVPDVDPSSASPTRGRFSNPAEAKVAQWPLLLDLGLGCKTLQGS